MKVKNLSFWGERSDIMNAIKGFMNCQFLDMLRFHSKLLYMEENPDTYVDLYGKFNEEEILTLYFLKGNRLISFETEEDEKKSNKWFGIISLSDQRFINHIPVNYAMAV